MFLDDEMFQKLAFRETLMISKVDAVAEFREVDPKPVGGLCLDVQMVQGYQPLHKEEPMDADLDIQVFNILQKMKAG